MVGGSGSIPAHAGEPHAILRSLFLARVYPRPRGGATHRSSPRHRTGGLSPPTRGSLGPGHRRSARRGSIPAHAGEPRWRTGTWRFAGVYPRPRGGAPATDRIHSRQQGLSPPTRGSLLWLPDVTSMSKGFLASHFVCKVSLEGEIHVVPLRQVHHRRLIWLTGEDPFYEQDAVSIPHLPGRVSKMP